MSPRAWTLNWRARLTLWNVAVLALVLAGFGSALCYSVHSWVYGTVDKELQRRAEGHAAGWERRGRFTPPSFSGFGNRDARVVPGIMLEPGFRRFGGPGGGGSRDWDRGGFPRDFDRGIPPREEEAERAAYFRRPRFLDMNGKPLGWDPEEQPWDRQGYAVARTGEVTPTTVVVDGDRVRVYSAPLHREEQIQGVVQVAYPLAEPDRLYGGVVRSLLMLIPLALLVAGIGGAFLAGRALRPVADVTAAAAQISAEDLSRRLTVSGSDEFSRLAATFNGMIARLESGFKNLEAAYEQQRRFVGDASHELRTPLTTIKANTSLALAGRRSEEEYREALEAADTAADTMTRIVQDLLLLARSDGGQLHPDLRATPLEEPLRRAMDAVSGRETAPVFLDLPDAPLAVVGDPHHLARLFNNLLENAARHTPADGQIVLSARAVGEQVRVQVCDTGEGIPPEHLPHVCERFYRVDAARARASGGVGLGLAICASIVEAHGGSLSVASESGHGTTVTVLLPAAECPAPAAADLQEAAC